MSYTEWYCRSSLLQIITSRSASNPLPTFRNHVDGNILLVNTGSSYYISFCMYRSDLLKKIAKNILTSCRCVNNCFMLYCLCYFKNCSSSPTVNFSRCLVVVHYLRTSICDTKLRNPHRLISKIVR